MSAVCCALCVSRGTKVWRSVTLSNQEGINGISLLMSAECQFSRSGGKSWLFAGPWLSLCQITSEVQTTWQSVNQCSTAAASACWTRSTPLPQAKLIELPKSQNKQIWTQLNSAEPPNFTLTDYCLVLRSVSFSHHSKSSNIIQIGPEDELNEQLKMLRVTLVWMWRNGFHQTNSSIDRFLVDKASNFT